ncbi:hypothetical protein JMA_22410 [Jeotgalibacillus malaysiensis]|uniref:Uncharacterized protein n=1 Tax=Jeotgalibacillus malaysiensis TaxID=1508404 RepID=A0A0B5ASL7_9BACL|nr:hypothetical protein [Jeotgalibacillus malaysiensis]AJD91558.1 hypothetical protein JMA_22410 [Jeotgalibacillus malaysiensis]
MKVITPKENYDLLRAAERTAGKKIKHLTAVVPDCVDGEWGAYQVIRCYKGASNYFAEMKLLKRAESEADAHAKVAQAMKELRQH